MAWGDNVNRTASSGLLCPYPFVPESYATGKGFTSQRFCYVGCCAQCPPSNAVWPNSLNTMMLIGCIIFVIGGLLHLYIVLSMILLPRAATHFNANRFTMSFGIFLVGLAASFNINQRPEFYCEDLVTTKNSGTCAVQGGLVLFGVIQATYSGVLRIFILWMPIVVNREAGKWLGYALNSIAWILPFTFLVIAIATRSLGYASLLGFCTVGWKEGLALFIIPIYVIGIIAGILQFTLVVKSFIIFAKVTRQTTMHTSQDPTISLSSMAMSENSAARRRLSPRRFVKLQLINASPFFVYSLGIIFAVAVLHRAIKGAVYNQGFSSEVILWVSCVAANGRDNCQPSYYPEWWLIGFSSIVMGLVSLVLFAQIFRYKTLPAWGVFFIEKRNKLMGSRYEEEWGPKMSKQEPIGQIQEFVKSKNISEPFQVRHGGGSFEERERTSSYPSPQTTPGFAPLYSNNHITSPNSYPVSPPQSSYGGSKYHYAESRDARDDGDEEWNGYNGGHNTRDYRSSERSRGNSQIRRQHSNESMDRAKALELQNVSPMYQNSPRELFKQPSLKEIPQYNLSGSPNMNALSPNIRRQDSNSSSYFRSPNQQSYDHDTYSNRDTRDTRDTARDTRDDYERSRDRPATRDYGTQRYMSGGASRANSTSQQPLKREPSVTSVRAQQQEAYNTGFI